MEKQFLFIVTKPPHSSASARESTDAIMAACAFGQPVHLLAMGDGVFQFTKHQDPGPLQIKNTAAMLESLPLYGTEKMMVLGEDLHERDLSENDFILPIVVLERGDLANIIQQSDTVLSY